MTSKSDLARYRRIMEVGCIACHIDGRYSIGDVHHLVDKGTRALSGGNKSTIILCLWHHRGVVPFGHTVDSATVAFGPSLFHTSKLFKQTYGTERELLAKVDGQIAVSA